MGFHIDLFSQAIYFWDGWMVTDTMCSTCVINDAMFFLHFLHKWSYAWINPLLLLTGLFKHPLHLKVCFIRFSFRTEMAGKISKMYHVHQRCITTVDVSPQKENKQYMRGDGEKVAQICKRNLSLIFFVHFDIHLKWHGILSRQKEFQKLKISKPVAYTESSVQNRCELTRMVRKLLACGK